MRFPHFGSCQLVAVWCSQLAASGVHGAPPLCFPCSDTDWSNLIHAHWKWFRGVRCVICCDSLDRLLTDIAHTHTMWIDPLILSDFWKSAACPKIIDFILVILAEKIKKFTELIETDLDFISEYIYIYIHIHTDQTLISDIGPKSARWMNIGKNQYAKTLRSIAVPSFLFQCFCHLQIGDCASHSNTSGVTLQVPYYCCCQLFTIE